LLRGNTQSDISRALHISQPTISRDIDYIKSKYITNSKNTYKRLSEEYINISLGVDEMIKNSWKIVDDNRTNVKSRLKAMSVIKECYKYKTEMLGTENVKSNESFISADDCQGERTNKKRKCIKSISRRKKTNTTGNRF
jgi:predicted transcriptional regulator